MCTLCSLLPPMNKINYLKRYYFLSFSPLPPHLKSVAFKICKSEKGFFLFVSFTIHAFMCSMLCTATNWHVDGTTNKRQSHRKSDRNINDDIYPQAIKLVFFPLFFVYSVFFLPQQLETEQYVNLWFLIFVFQSHKYWIFVIFNELPFFVILWVSVHFTISFKHNLILKIYFLLYSVAIGFAVLQSQLVSILNASFISWGNKGTLSSEKTYSINIYQFQISTFD